MWSTKNNNNKKILSYKNLPIQSVWQIQSPSLSLSVCACVRWVVVYSQLSAPQGHHTNRDSWGPRPITGRHSDCTPCPLKSRHFRAAVHCSPSLISASSSGGKSGPDPGFQQTFYLTHVHTNACDLSPFTHTSLMMSEEMP